MILSGFKHDNTETGRALRGVETGRGGGGVRMEKSPPFMLNESKLEQASKAKMSRRRARNLESSSLSVDNFRFGGP